jgi:hypothetical protein
MVEAGITRIEGTIHRFAIYNKPDQLEITSLDLIPVEFFKLSLRDELIMALLRARNALVVAIKANVDPSLKINPDENLVVQIIDAALARASDEPPDRELDKAKLIEALNAGQEVPGAYILRNRKRLDIK